MKSFPAMTSMLWARNHRIAVAVIACVLAGITAGALYVWRTSDDPSPVALRIAYLTGTELAVVVDGTVQATADGNFADAGQGPVWSNDQRLVTAVSDPRTPSAQLVVIDADNGTGMTVDCSGCANVAAYGRRGFVWTGSDRRIRRVDIVDGQPGKQILMASQTTFTQSFDALAGTSSETLLAGAHDGETSAYGGPQNLMLLLADGRITDLETPESNAQIQLATAADTTPYGGRRIAFVTWMHFSACEENATVALIDPRDGRTLATTSPLGPPEPGTTSAVLDLWWGHDGRLFATMSRWRCGDSGDREFIRPPSLWRLDTQGWSPVEAEAARSVRLAGDEVLAVVTSEPGTDTGSLVWVRGGGRTLISEGVRFMSTAAPAPPREA